tara:strand:+ start:3430 stop:3897 length:468 start_codon:yes stop_codon:yes gene_type:complete
MSKFKKMYRDFFGLQEQNSNIPDAEKIKASTAAMVDLNKELDKAASTMKIESDLEEAQLINNLSDYNGHVTYYVKNPQEASAVAKEIQQWTTKKGFTIIAHKKLKKGRIGYFYFRLGEDPGSESQKIQGYFAQLPELSKFLFKKPRKRKRPSRKF